ncbi:MAG: Reverse gyrase 1 [Methanosaeta sp. PtaU1.Bin112]|nr:MAG: Reverse gyrase 1 [Methanosaeta sp. PtaU1.Bin112]
MHLIIAEKHDAAKRIAQILAGSKPSSKRVAGVDTYCFDDKVVMGLSGHIVGVDYPQGYNNWQKVDCKDLIRAEIVVRPIQDKIISALQSLGKKADRITIATDYDREGELIGVEALKIAQKANPGLHSDRVRYSAIVKEEILKAFKDRGDVDYSLAASGEARQIIDLVWGAALTRYISLTSGRLGKEFLSVGRVQSPTLALIVDREREIQSFVPKPYWEIYADLEKELAVQHAKGRIWDKAEVDGIISRLGPVGAVKSIETKPRVDKPPAPFDTTSFIAAASGIGFSAANAMRLAEWLYVNGFISYPRTDNTVYPPSIDLKALTRLFLNSAFSSEAEKLLQGKMQPTRGKRSTTDHPPIYPTAPAEKGELKEDQWRIYELVVRRFFATLAEPCVWDATSLKVDIGPEPFRANGTRLVEPGWRYYYPYSKAEEHILPKLEKGERLRVLGHSVEAKETQPPARFSQGKLIKLMDELGLGTKSTRHDIISKLYARAYVQGNPMRPTNTAYAVVDTLEKYAPTITKPEMTQTLENDMNLISERNIKEDEVIEKSRVMLTSVFDELTTNQDGIGQSLKDGLRTDKIVGTCQKCQSDLIIRRGHRGTRFIGCSGYPECRFTLPLPRFGTVVVTDKKCEEHGMLHIRIINKGKRPWDLGCPHCNFLEWQTKKAQEKADPTKAKEKAKPKAAKATGAAKSKKKATPISQTKGDGLVALSGIGPKTLEKLTGAGIKTAADLARAKADSLAKITGISAKKISAWQKAAGAMS